jgi:predicted SAM-dependent methyltransferase
MRAADGGGPEPLRLHIGGTQARPGWKILNIQPGPAVDFVGDCKSLAQFSDGSVEEIYAAHVLEHLGYERELPLALTEMRRVLAPGRLLRLSVPDLDVLCGMFCDPNLTREQRFHVMRMIFGGQLDRHDLHKTGLNWEFLSGYLAGAGFVDVARVADFGLFPGDCSSLRFAGRMISLNVMARRP